MLTLLFIIISLTNNQDNNKREVSFKTDPSSLHNNDDVTIQDGVEAVSYCKDRTVRETLSDRLLDLSVCCCINGRRGLVQYQNLFVTGRRLSKLSLSDSNNSDCLSCLQDLPYFSAKQLWLSISTAFLRLKNFLRFLLSCNLIHFRIV